MKSQTYSFVRETKRDVYWNLRKKEIEFLQDPVSGRIKKEFAEPVIGCLLCQSQERDTLFEKEGFLFHRCRVCSFVYADPQIKENELIAAYASSLSSDAWIDVLLSRANYQYDTEKYTIGLKKISVIQSRGRILDIGCSIGHFLKLAHNHGWETIGLELNLRAAKHAREVWGLTVIDKFLSDAAFKDGSFEAVTMWGVIEHLKDPSDAIREVHRILVPGGVLLTFCPNIDSLVCRVLHEKASCFDGRNHCGYFSPKTIRYLFERCGFKIAETLSFQPELDTVLNYLNYSNPYLGELNQKNPIKELLGQSMQEPLEQIMLGKNLGYKMMTIAQRI